MRFRGPLTSCAFLCVCSLLAGCNRTNGFMMNRVGAQHYNSGNYAAAQQYFHMAAADNPQSADYLHNLACAMKKQGQVGKAEELYRRALDVDPMHQPSNHALAMLLKEQGRTAEAKAWLNMWAETQPYIAEPQVELAWLNRELGQHAESEANLRQALKIDPTNATALAHLGQVYQDQGRPQEAVAMYRRSLYQNWYQPDVKSRVSGLSGPQLARPYSPGPAFAAQPQPVIIQQPTTQSAVTLLPPVISGTASMSTGQPVQLGIPVTSSDPAHPGEQISSVPTVEAH